MTVKTHTVEPVDSLSLLSLKVASNVFDVSSGVHHLSIRDQIVRARMLVRDLKQGDKKVRRILIVGAGVAGMSAALTACELGIEEVVVVEAKDEPLALMRGVTKRHVGPYMYEWPSPFYDNQTYPEEEDKAWLGNYSSPLCWDSKLPLSANALALALEDDLVEEYANGVTHLPEIYVCAHRHTIKKFVKDFAKREASNSLLRLQKHAQLRSETLRLSANEWPALNALGKKVPINPCAQISLDFAPQYVILAAGMGEENIRLTETPGSYSGISFWANDDLLSPPKEARRIAIFGGGDGALQDVLRVLTGFEHPLKFIEHLERKQSVKRALESVTPLLLSVERQSRQFSGWTKGHFGYSRVDNHCRKIAARLAKNVRVVRHVLKAIRLSKSTTPFGDDTEVALFVREHYFDKAYLLNRFLVHLIDACFREHQRTRSKKSKSTRPTKIPLRIFWGHKAIGSAPYGRRFNILVENIQTNANMNYEADHIVVRYGITKDTVPGKQMIQVSPKSSAQRTTLCRVELPFAVPSNA